MIKGTKIIFVRDGGVLNTNIGNVFTFANWWDRESAKNNSFYRMYPYRLTDFDEGQNNHHRYFQVEELLAEGNTDHNLSFYCVEIFDPIKHKEFKLMTPEVLAQERKAFIEKYG